MNREKVMNWLKEEIQKCDEKKADLLLKHDVLVQRAKAFTITLNELSKLDAMDGLFEDEPAPPQNLGSTNGTCSMITPIKAEPLVFGDAPKAHVQPESTDDGLKALGCKAFRPQRLAQLLSISIAAATQRCYKFEKEGKLVKVSPGEFRVTAELRQKLGSDDAYGPIPGVGGEPEVEPEAEPVADRAEQPKQASEPYVSQARSATPLFLDCPEGEATPEQKLEKAKADLIVATSEGRFTMVSILKDKIKRLETLLAGKADK